MTMSVVQANLNLAHEVFRNARLGGEADARVNDASRELIAAMREDRGDAWLGKINLYSEESRAMWKWRGELVYNFAADFVAPCYDEELVNLILARQAATYSTVRADMIRVDQIMARLAAIGGVSLVWT